MEDTGIRIGTFNIGQGYHDYLYMCYADDEQREALVERVGNVKANEGVVCKVQEEWAAELIAQKVDVLCIQELMREDRSFVVKLKERGFTMTRLDGEISTAIAFRSTKFQAIEFFHLDTSDMCPDQLPCYGKDVAVAKFTLKSGKSLAVASVHSPGLDLYGPQQQRPSIMSDHNVQRLEQANQYHSHARKRIAELSADYTIIAGDMNNNPENYRKTFDQYAQHGFGLLRTNKGTNVNLHEQDCSPREIDFLFLRETSSVQRVINYVRACFVNVKQLKNEMRPVVADGFAFEHDKNCSDHLPLVVTVKEVDVAGSKLAVVALVAFVVLAAFGALHFARSSEPLVVKPA